MIIIRLHNTPIPLSRDNVILYNFDPNVASALLPKNIIVDSLTNETADQISTYIKSNDEIKIKYIISSNNRLSDILNIMNYINETAMTYQKHYSFSVESIEL